MSELLALQNGSDIRGIAIQTDEHDITLTDDAIQKIAQGITLFLKQKKKLSGRIKVAIGHDSRLSAERIKLALTEVLSSNGIEVLDAHLATTPAMFMATQYEEINADCGIMITASHLPYFYNGIKIFTQSGGAEKENIRYILEYATEKTEDTQAATVKNIDLMSLYAADLVRKIREKVGTSETPLAGSKIVVDAGNGAGGFFAKSVLAPLGADVSASQFLEPDGHFPNHIPNPDNDEAMASLQKAVLESKADLGVIFDTDVDRAAIMDQNGESLNRNALIAIISAILLKEHPETTIVTDSTTSDHLRHFIESLSGRQYRFKRGYRNVIGEAIRLNEAGIPSEIAIEVSGHAALKENYFLDDGAYLVARILMEYAKLKADGEDLTSLIASLKQPAESMEMRLQILDDDFKPYGQKVLSDFEAFIKQTPDFELEPNNYEGIRVQTSGKYGSGWFLLRMSLHEPVMPLNIESDTKGGIEQILTDLRPFFEGYKALKF
ncbi:phosphomannomutase/phosphoglucomutase [Listeria fleischmannii]|uniref:phosphomannomutase/phosphoglucomutase n=1 Tax=Listeria fleischmannii TaxID=1069827 RepID=UPI0016248174|nr:phosphomannomutase/phosphoglucomutase [Listeria fleischmannii]MBC1419531.1 phosphomannomutase/phosphoglucomutase [Listeria fleischmannii]